MGNFLGGFVLPLLLLAGIVLVFLAHYKLAPYY